MTATIRRATPDDIEDMERCVARAYRHYIDRLGKEPGPMMDDYGARVAKDHAFVMTEFETVVGVLVLISDPDRCLLDNVAVDPDCSGRGLGRQLVSFAEGQAKAMGYGELQLYTHERMTENVAMYEKWGYRTSRRIRGKGL